ncbi:uncharacterized protein LOC130722777 [Lotus japonicus]|uniref:uncharacterized protein LOC130722777 n=1 Tax=Lotus japonicus TaxID=34305 RepID=UPI002585DDD9|nr:uncharacterized protein LOC130722777 [Lotus japonicus]
MATEAPYFYTVEDVLVTSCPLYVHPNENPSIVLVSPPLSESNYHSWSRSMRMSLLTKNKLVLVDGSLPEPAEDHPIHPFWQRCNTMVLGWLIRSMNTEIAQSIMWRERAIDVWKELKERFSQVDLFRISELQEEIYSLKQGDLSVTKYFTAMKILIDELEVLKSLPSCTCEALTKIKEDRNSDHVIHFLRGLNEQFSGVRSQIMLMDLLPSINLVFQLVAQQERQFSVEHVLKVLMANANGSSDSQKSHGNGGKSANYHSGSTSGAYRSGSTSGASGGRNPHGESSSTYNGYRNQGRKVCSYCGRNGHTVDVCYKKHGYPQSFKSKNSSSQGHQKHVNMTMGTDSGASTEDDDAGLIHGDTMFSLTEAQYNSLISLMPGQDQEPQRTAKVNFAPTTKTFVVA